MSGKIVAVVEGKKSEVQTVPLLLRRILRERMNVFDDIVAKPVYLSRTKIKDESELRRTIELAQRTRAGAEAILFLCDSDDDPVCVLGPELLSKAGSMTHLPVAVVLAKKELECWFLGAKESLRGERGIRQDANNHPNPEDIRSGKEHLTKNMESGRRYLETDDQAALAAKMDIEMARRNCPSFDKLIREVEKLVARMSQSPRSTS
ncbi:MAG: DUF4276 family protein [bacterium]